MRKRKLLKSIGTAGVVAGFSTVAQANETKAESKPVKKETLNRYLESKPVQSLLNKIGATFNNPTPQDIKLEITEKPTKNRVVASDKSIIVGVQIKTNGGVIGLTLKGDDVFEALFVKNKKYRSLKSENKKNGSKMIETEAETVDEKSAMIVAGSDYTTYVRTATEKEKKEIKRNEIGTVSNCRIMEESGDIYYLYNTIEGGLSGDSSDASEKIKVAKKSTGDIVVERVNNSSMKTEDIDCDPDRIPGCVLDFTDSSYYCYLASEACKLSAGFGIKGLVACLAAGASLCGGRLVVAAISGSCADVAGCVQDYCNENPNQCPGGMTPLYPT